MNDYISRQAAIDELRKCRFVVDAIEKIRGLPTAQPEKVCIANITLSEEQILEAVEKAKNEVVRVLLDAQPTADVVEADKAQKEIDYWHDKAQSYEQTILKLSLNKADVVEVVRCKDCKYRDTMPEYEYDDDHEHRTLMGTDFCRWWHDESPNDDDYCSYGERAEE